MFPQKIWDYRQMDPEYAMQISRELGISLLTAKVLTARGMQDMDEIRQFLHPSFSDLHDPFLLIDMDVAASRILKAVKANERITIYGDYDVDGVTSTAILYRFLSEIGAKVDYFIPDRQEEGYGLSLIAIDKILSIGTDLIITVDCGTTAVDEVRYLIDHQVDIVITDHHECKEILPAAAAVVNPHRSDCSYPYKQLAGVGVTFKLICALSKGLGREERIGKYLDLVAVGTIADVVPLTEENRILVKYGMEEIIHTSNIGLCALMQISGLLDKPITAWGVAFGIAPRINAAGRIGDAERSVRLFITESEKEANDIAFELNEENKRRQATEAEILQQVITMVEAQPENYSQKVIVVAGEGWHHGVIGIVASRITEKYYKPSILISTEDGVTGKASGRSVEGFNLFEALCSCDDLLEKYGGHELAAGLTVKMDNVDDFRTKINTYAEKVMTSAMLIPKVKVDAILDARDISIDGIDELQQLAPFGAGNPSPLFCCKKAKIADIRAVGDGKHLKLKVSLEKMELDAIGFGLGGYTDCYHRGDILEVACSLDINTWNSQQKAQLNIRDLRPGDEKTRERQIYYNVDKYIEFQNASDYNRDNSLLQGITVKNMEDLVPEREDLAVVYQFLKRCAKEGSTLEDFDLAAERIEKVSGTRFTSFKLKKCIEIFEELNLVRTTARRKGITVCIADNGSTKTNLENSALYRKLQGLKSRCKEEYDGFKS